MGSALSSCYGATSGCIQGLPNVEGAQPAIAPASPAFAAPPALGMESLDSGSPTSGTSTSASPCDGKVSTVSDSFFSLTEVLDDDSAQKAETTTEEQTRDQTKDLESRDDLRCDVPVDSGDSLEGCSESRAQSANPLIGYFVGGRYKIVSQIGKGGHGQVYVAEDARKSGMVAVKVQPVADESLPRERSVYRRLKAAGCTAGFPQVAMFRSDGTHNLLVMQLLGPSVYDTFGDRPMPIALVANLCWQMLHRLETLHQCGFAHCDLKPENIVSDRNNPQVLHLIDFGVAQPLRDSRGSEEEMDVFVGTSLFAPGIAHDAGMQSRRDDLESLGYVAVSLMGRKLPWEGKGGTEEDIWEVVGELKRKASPEELVGRGPVELMEYCRYVRGLKSKDMPDYGMLRGLMEQMGKR